MGKDARNALIGIVLVAASFALPGIPIVAGLTLNGLLFTAGSGFLATAFTAPLGESQATNLQMSIGPTSHIPVVYGQARVGVSLADARKHPSNADILYVVGAFCIGSEAGGGIEDVTSVFFDDFEAISNPDTTGTLSTTGIDSHYSGKLSYAIHRGTDAQTVDAELASVFTTEWPATSDGRGIAYIVLKLTHDPEVYPNGLPNVTLVVQGQKVFDPRDSSTAYSTNPALCVLDWLTSTKYGYGIPIADIDTDSFEDAANFCDEDVNTTAYSGDRFTCNGVADTSEARDAILNALLSSCRGQLVYQGGKFRIVINQIETAETFELTEDNIVGDWEFSRVGRVPNSVTATFIDPARNYQPSEVTWPEAGQTNNFLTADNDILSQTGFDLPFTQNVYIAQQIAMVTLREAREDIVVAVTAKQEALKLQVGEVVPLTHSTPGFSQKEFRVATMAPLPNATVRLLLREYDDDCYTLDTQNTQDTGSNTDLANAATCQPPSGLTLTSDDTTEVTVGGVRLTRIFVEWTASPDPFLHHYEIRHKPTSASEYVYEADIPREAIEAYTVPVDDAVEHTVEIRAVNTLGVPSPWVTDTTTPDPVFYDAEITFAAAHFNGDRLFVTVAGDEDTRTSGVAIVGTASHPSTPVDPTLASNDFTLSNARAGIIDTGIDVPDPGSGVEMIGFVKVAAVNGAGVVGPVITIPANRKGIGQDISITLTQSKAQGGTDCSTDPAQSSVTYSVTGAAVDDTVTIERWVDGVKEATIRNASTTHSDTITDDHAFFESGGFSPTKQVQYYLFMKTNNGLFLAGADKWSNEVVFEGVTECP